MNLFKQNLDDHILLFNKLFQIEKQVLLAIELCAKTIEGGGKLIFCGNGGSAADSQHIVAEFVGRFIRDRRPLPALALTTDTSIITSVANDYSFNDVFGRQVQALGKPGDCLIGISTSGNSVNVLNAFNVARALGINTIALVGKGGGEMSKATNVSIVVPSDVTARIQEAHIMIGHILCSGVEHYLNLT